MTNPNSPICNRIMKFIWKHISCFFKYLPSFLAIANIYIIQLTEWRPLGVAPKCNEINELILNLSYSYLAAMIFHIIMVVIPNVRRRKIMRRKIDYYLHKVKELIMQCVTNLHMYDLDEARKNNITKEQFVREFTDLDLYKYKVYWDILIKNREKINFLIEIVLGMQEHLSDDEVNKLLLIRDMSFLAKPICPRDLIEDDNGNILETPSNNQYEIADSIYTIYNLFK